MLRNSNGAAVRDESPTTDGLLAHLALIGTPGQRVLISGLEYVSAPFRSGVATFADLFVNDTGTYKLRAWVDQQPRRVTAVSKGTVQIGRGLPVGILVATQPGGATGGVEFTPQPVIAVVDAAGNVCTDVSGITASVSLASAPASLGGSSSPLPGLLQSRSGFTAAVDAGAATFRGLFIDPAGDGFQLRFTLDVSQQSAAPWSSSLVNATSTSRPFAVAVGPTWALEVTTQPGGARGGLPFRSQPVVSLKDRGGNLNVQDSYSTITASIFDNAGYNVADEIHSSWRSAHGRGRLGPTLLRRRYPPSVITASVQSGSVFVDLSVDPMSLEGSAYPVLRNGDSIAIGGPLYHHQGGGDVDDEDGDGSHGRGAEYPWRPADTHRKFDRTAADTGHDSIQAYPIHDLPGATVRLVLPDQRRLRLHRPWAGPAMVDAPLWRIQPGLTVPVIRGVADFNGQGLAIDMVGVGYTLRFTSSLVAVSGWRCPGSDTGPLRPDDDETRHPPLPSDCTWVGAGSDTAPYGIGYGEAGMGIGHGAAERLGSNSSITVVSRPFDVIAGRPHRLAVVRMARRAWAGGHQPMAVQPRVALVDAGGNLLYDRNGYPVWVSLYSDGVVDHDTALGHHRHHHPPVRLDEYLAGTRAVPLIDGAAEWIDLGIDTATWTQGVMQSINGTLFNNSHDAALLERGASSFSLRFSVHVPGHGSMSVVQRGVTVAHSAEYMVHPSIRGGDDADDDDHVDAGGPPDVGGVAQDFPPLLPINDGDRYGHAVAVSDALLAVGAPLADQPAVEVVVVRLLQGWGDALPANLDNGASSSNLASEEQPPSAWETQQQRVTVSVPEVQTVTVGAVWRPAVQQVAVAANDSTVNVDCSLALSLAFAGAAASTRQLPCFASDPAYIQAVIEADVLIPLGLGSPLRQDNDDDEAAVAGSTGVVHVSSEYGTTAADGVGRSASWNVAFTGVHRVIPVLGIVVLCNATSTGHGQPDSNYSSSVSVIYSGVNISAAVTEVVPATTVGGWFKLALPRPGTQQAGATVVANAAAAAIDSGDVNASSGTSVAFFAVTRPLPHDITPTDLAAALTADLQVGPVQVEQRTLYGSVADDGGAGYQLPSSQWSITFPLRSDVDGTGNDVPTLYPVVNGSLTGYGAYARVDAVQAGVSPVRGTFQLRVQHSDGDDGSLVATAPIPWDASGTEFAAALRRAGVGCGVSVAAVGRLDGTGIARSRTDEPSSVIIDGHGFGVLSSWRVTFTGRHSGGDDDGCDDDEGTGAFPSLHVDPSLASPPNASGKGYAWVPWGQSAAPGMLTGGYGDGSRHGRPFLQVAAAVDKGSPGPRPWEGGQAGVRAGSAGYQAGRVYLYRRVPGSKRWLPDLAIVPDPLPNPQMQDRSHDLFGHSLSLADSSAYPFTPPSSSDASFEATADPVLAQALSENAADPPSSLLLAVGAPGARNWGTQAAKSIACAADGGWFTLTVLGKTTDRVWYNSTRAHLRQALHALPLAIQVVVQPGQRGGVPSSSFDPVTGINSDLLFAALEDSLCSSTADAAGPRTTLITFLYPSDGVVGAMIPDGTALEGDSQGHVPVLSTTDEVVGTAVSSGTAGKATNWTTGQSSGAVYVFEPVPSWQGSGDAYDGQGWVQTAMLQAPAISPRGGDMYGWSVAATVNGAYRTLHTLVVGAPGDTEDGGEDAGAVYVYNRSPRHGAVWQLPQRLLATTHNSVGGQGYRFGWSVAMGREGDTIAVGCPGANGGSGGVWVFKRQPTPDALFFLDQVLTPIGLHAAQTVASPLAGLPVSLGHAVSFSSTVLVAGAPGAAYTAGLDRNSTTASAEPVTGCAYIYTRPGWGSKDNGGYLQLSSVACPQAAIDGDRVGISVAAGDNAVVVGASTRYVGPVEDRPPGFERPTEAMQPGTGWYSQPSLQHEVQAITIQLEGINQRNGSTADGTFSLQWRRRPIVGVPNSLYSALPAWQKARLGVVRGDSKGDGSDAAGWASVTSRRLPWNATAREVRRALENDLGTGSVRVWRRITREGCCIASITWRITFLDQPEGDQGYQTLPLLRVKSRLTSTATVTEGSGWSHHGSGAAGADAAAGGTAVPRAFISVSRITAPSLPTRGAAYLYTRDPRAGSGAAWRPTAALHPHASQARDGYGLAVGLSATGSFASVGAPSRTVALTTGSDAAELGRGIWDRRNEAVASPVVTGSAFVYSLSWLNLQIGADSSSPPSLSDSTLPMPTAIEEGADSGRDTVSRGHHAGLGLVTAAQLPLQVIACGGVMDDDGVDGQWDVINTSHCMAPIVPRNNVDTVGDRGAAVYVSTADGDDWGWHTLSRGDAVPPSGQAAALANAFPAVTDACHDSDYDSAYDGSGHGCDAARVADKGTAMWSEDGVDALRTCHRPSACSTSRFCGPSDCSEASSGTGECHFTADGRYSVGGLMDYVPATRLLRFGGYDGSGDCNISAAPVPDLQPMRTASILPLLIQDDDVHEPMDETLHVRAWLPGMHPLYGGPLWGTVRVVDDGDGGVGSQGYLQMVRPAEDAVMQEGSSSFGSAIAIDGDWAVVGSHAAARQVSDANGSTVSMPVGDASILRRTAGLWVHHTPSLDPGDLIGTHPGAMFGSAVALLSTPTAVYAAVSAPGIPAVAVYAMNSTSDGAARGWQRVAVLVPDLQAAEAAGLTSANLSRPVDASDGFGGRGALAMMRLGTSDSAIVVAAGCRGAEAVFLYRNNISSGACPAAATGRPLGVDNSTASSSLRWCLTGVLRSSEHLAIIAPGAAYSVPAGFGSSVAAHGSTLVVGAPWSQGTAAAQAQPTGSGGGATTDDTQYRNASWTSPSYDHATEYAQGYGSGAVFVFSLVPGLQSSHYNPMGDVHGKMATNWSSLAGWVAGDAAVATGSSVHVVDDAIGGDAAWVQQSVLVSLHARAGDRYGSAISISGGTIAVGSPGAALQSSDSGVTWDFETGDLRGWTATGDAFAYQPTFGDSSAARPGYPTRLGPGRAAVSGHRGRYYLSTYDARPADMDATNSTATVVGSVGRTTGIAQTWDAADPAGAAPSSTTPGSVQGDGPTGTLTSQPFIIAGAAISMLVGGGCDDRLVYVELVVDGVAAARATGTCDAGEGAMRRVLWDVSRHVGSAGVIRIVDSSSTSPWGHLSIDEIQVGWGGAEAGFAQASDGGAVYLYRLVERVNDGTTVQGSDPASARYAGRIPTSSEPDSAVSAFQARPTLRPPFPQPRNVPAFVEPCAPTTVTTTPLGCVWRYEGKVVAPDASTAAMFGYSVAVDDASGILVVGAPQGRKLDPASQGNPASATGQDALHQREQYTTDADRLQPPSPPAPGFSVLVGVNSSSGGQANTGLSSMVQGLQGTALSGGLSRNHSSPAMGPESQRVGSFAGTRAGQFYVYRSEPDKRSGQAQLLAPRTWSVAALTVDRPHFEAEDRLGQAVVIDGFIAVVGSPAVRAAPGSGAVTVFDLAVPSYISFSPRDFSDPALQRPGSGDNVGDFQRGPDSEYDVGAVGAHIQEYTVLEGFHLHEIAVPVYRHGVTYTPPGSPQSLLAARTMHVHYATRDITAVSVSQAVADRCNKLPVELHDPVECGDYVRQAGELVFPPGGTSRQDIIVAVMDDQCQEECTKTFAIDLYLPGAAKLNGPTYSVTVRIDDDDGDMAHRQRHQTEI